MHIKKNFFKYFLMFSLVLTSLLSIATISQAKTYYVAKNNPGGCSDNWPGTGEKPWCTIQKAATTMVAGDSVYVEAGIYGFVGLRRSGSAGSPISFLAYPRDVPVTSQWYFGNDVSYIKIVGFEITYAKGGGVQMNRNNDHNVISNCHIHHCRPGGSCGVDISNGGDYNIIENNVIHDVYYAFHTSSTLCQGNIFRGNICYNISDDGINISPLSKDTQIINNIIYNVEYYGTGKGDGIHYFDDGTGVVSGNLIYHSGAATGGALWVHGGTNHKVANNTVIALPGYSCQFDCLIWIEMVQGALVKNNIGYVNNTKIGVVLGISGSTNDDYNDWYNAANSSMCVYYGGWKSVSAYQSKDGRGLHCISEDPKFVDLATNNFHLQASSPCIDAGDPGTDPALDLDGRRRPQDGDEDGNAIVDMGAYEYPGPDSLRHWWGSLQS